MNCDFMTGESIGTDSVTGLDNAKTNSSAPSDDK